MSGNGRFETQDNNPNAWVGVSSDGVHEDTGTPVASEFIIQGKNPPDHIHLGFDESGDQLFGPSV
ncbi:hypothetical protein [Amycolatopsis sp. NBC_01480]|uniref:hypothetical protein n=1 Tax=Amycolatopsis sp. NBC_01480 TaxID=2903562 RepID=UPI002E29A107|nr:hypothetical protein [Amycolatopsis sp. NBC_01480]